MLAFSRHYLVPFSMETINLDKNSENLKLDKRVRTHIQENLGSFFIWRVQSKFISFILPVKTYLGSLKEKEGKKGLIHILKMHMQFQIFFLNTQTWTPLDCFNYKKVRDDVHTIRTAPWLKRSKNATMGNQRKLKNVKPPTDTSKRSQSSSLSIKPLPCLGRQTQTTASSPRALPSQ